jgi:hypothetical protein
MENKRVWGGGGASSLRPGPTRRFRRPAAPAPAALGSRGLRCVRILARARCCLPHVAFLASYPFDDLALCSQSHLTTDRAAGHPLHQAARQNLAGGPPGLAGYGRVPAVRVMVIGSAARCRSLPASRPRLSAPRNPANVAAARVSACTSCCRLGVRKLTAGRAFMAPWPCLACYRDPRRSRSASAVPLPAGKCCGRCASVARCARRWASPLEAALPQRSGKEELIPLWKERSVQRSLSLGFLFLDEF